MEVQEMIRKGDVAEISFVRNDFKGEVKMRPDRIAKYSDKFRGGIPPRRAPQFYFLVSTKFDPEVTFSSLNAELTPHVHRQALPSVGGGYRRHDRRSRRKVIGFPPFLSYLW